MGLAASQARLLSLTARQHTVEGRAQYLQAQKLRLANESDRVYENYVNALDATSIQTKSYDSNGKVHWLDGSLNNMMRYDADDKSLGNIYYVQDINSGKLYMPSKIVNAYNGAGNDLFQFMDNLGMKYEKDVYNDEYMDALRTVNAYKNEGYDTFPYSQAQVETYKSLRSETLNPAKSSTYNNADELYKLVSFSESTTNKGVYYPSDKTQYSALLAQLDNIKGTSYYTGTNKTIIDYISSFDVSAIFADTSNITNLSATTNEPDKTLYVYWDKAKENEKENEEDKQQIDELTKLKMLLNGGSWKKTSSTFNIKDPLTGTILTDEATTTGNIYTDDMQNTLNAYTGTNNANMGEALVKMASDIKDSETNKALTTANNNFQTFFTSIGTTQEEFETKLSNYNTYNNAVADLSTKDQTTYTKYEDDNLGPYYEQIFNAINAAGGCTEITTENAKSGSWLTNMVKNAQVVLATFDNDKKELDNITASSNVGLREISNDREITKADSEYEADMEAINSKETKYNTQLNQLESERNAIKTEIESLKQIREDNISSTFKLFS